MKRTRLTKVASGTMSPPGSGLAGYRDMPMAADDVIRNPDGVFSGLTRRNAGADGVHAAVQGVPKGPTTVKLGRQG
jgi:hypothetical protein